MINFVLQDKMFIRVDTESREILNGITDFLTERPESYAFSPAFKSGFWDGWICLFKKSSRLFPYGLFLDVLKYVKNTFPEEPYTIDPNIKDLFTGSSFKINYDLKLQPRYYQQECVEAALKTSKGIIVSSTSSGKSLMIAYVVNNLHNEFPNQQSIIIVPNKSLIAQFYNDLIEYGIDENLIGRAYAEMKEFNKPIVISTWQILQNRLEELQRYHAVIVDEVHGAKADVLSKILQECTNAKYRLGFTGTLPNNLLNQYNIKSYLGPVLKTYNSRHLSDAGFISKSVIRMIEIEYEGYSKYRAMEYDEVRDATFQNPYRIGFIKHLINTEKDSFLILVELVEKEGEFLTNILKESFPNKEIIFLSGKNSSDEREYYRRYTENNNVILLGTYGILQTGVNIKRLKHLILATPSKSKIRVLQSIGRLLRKHEIKEDGIGAIIWDIADRVKYLEKHSAARYKHYAKERHNIEEYCIREMTGAYNMDRLNKD